MIYTPRAQMPQVDEKDLTHLISEAFTNNHAPSLEVVDPMTLHAHQRINAARAKTMPVELRRKPVLVSKDDFILDGNHRWWAHRYNNDSPMNIIRLDLLFDAALEWLFTLPFVYRITPQTPERN